MHTLFMREHNRVSEQLAKLNSHWSDERLYQTTRKIISAFEQQITFGEFLPRLIGKDYLDRYGLTLLSSGYYTGYDPKCSATLRNEIAGAVVCSIYFFQIFACIDNPIPFNSASTWSHPIKTIISTFRH